METVIVEITITATGDKLDFMLPAHVPLEQIIGELIRKLEQYMPSVMIDKENPVLYIQDTTKQISPEQTLAQAGIQDGSRLVLV